MGFNRCEANGGLDPLTKNTEKRMFKLVFLLPIHSLNLELVISSKIVEIIPTPMTADRYNTGARASQVDGYSTRDRTLAEHVKGKYTLA